MVPGRVAERPARKLVIDAGPQTALTQIFRTRAFRSDEKLMEALCRPDKHLGSPPAALAVSGRMNARGISVFYGANDSDVAIADFLATENEPVLDGIVFPSVGAMELPAGTEIEAHTGYTSEDG